MIPAIGVTCSSVAISSPVRGEYSNAAGVDTDVKEVSEKADTSSVSTLSRQLGESAVRAEARDKSMTRHQLCELARKAVDGFLGDSYITHKARHNAEVPKTDDPDLIERARQATAYANKAVAQYCAPKNPFAHLTAEQAVLIAYDDKGPYTVNERHAAWSHSNQLEEQWRAAVIVRGTQEYNSCGKNPKFMTECLEHYRALPAIEQARYDAGYEARLLSNINSAGGELKSDDRRLTLFEILAGIQRPEKKAGEATREGQGCYREQGGPGTEGQQKQLATGRVNVRPQSQQYNPECLPRAGSPRKGNVTIWCEREGAVVMYSER